jgi:hypothetical protein
MRKEDEMEKVSGAVFHGLFKLMDGVTEAEFLLAFDAFYSHLVEMGYARNYRVMRRHPLDGFGNTLPPFEYLAEVEFPTLAEDQACYEYVKRNEEPVRSLHRAMNSKVRRGSADFFLTVRVGGSP